jgi:hypothetical protein
MMGREEAAAKRRSTQADTIEKSEWRRHCRRRWWRRLPMIRPLATTPHLLPLLSFFFFFFIALVPVLVVVAFLVPVFEERRGG